MDHPTSPKPQVSKTNRLNFTNDHKAMVLMLSSAVPFSDMAGHQLRPRQAIKRTLTIRKQPPCDLSPKDTTGLVDRNPHRSNMDNTTLFYASPEPSDRQSFSTTPDGQFLPRSNAVHPLHRQLQLMACKVSGSPSSRELFQAKLPTSSCSLCQLVPKNNMPHISRNGMTFALNGKLIHTIHL